jgi:hypothetical protein
VHEQLQGEPILFIIAFARHGSPYSAYIYDKHLQLPHSAAAEITVDISDIRLGSGIWYVSIGAGEPGLYEKPGLKYFTVDSSWHHMLASRLELKVATASKIDALGCFVVHPAVVSVRNTESADDQKIPENALR